MNRDVFVIDDDLVSQFAARYCINQYDPSLRVTTCDSGEDGLSKCLLLLEDLKPLPSIIFLDLSMGDMDGWTFIENLQHITRENTPPRIYVLSSFVNAKDRAIAKDHPLVAGYFDKPLSRIDMEVVFKIL